MNFDHITRGNCERIAHLDYSVSSDRLRDWPDDYLTVFLQARGHTIKKIQKDMAVSGYELTKPKRKST